MEPSPHIEEDIVFTPFTETSINKLKSWLDHDFPLDVTSAFGPSALTKTTPNPEFLKKLLALETKALSMMVTIRTSYHSLLHIGYVQLSQINKAKRECAINYLYISKPFRHKDYEYRTFQKIVDFVLKNMRCERCLIWVGESNYLFLSLAKTLKLKLVKIGTEGHPMQKRYCYMVGQVKSIALNNYLFRKYAINLDTIERTNEKKPDLSIENYMDFKSRLQEINKIHWKSGGKKKSTIYYSPAVKSTRDSFGLRNKGCKSVGSTSPQIPQKVGTGKLMKEKLVFPSIS